MTGFFDDDGKLTFPEADRIVDEYLTAVEKPRTTSKVVLRWAEYEDTPHNRRRVYDALSRVGTETDVRWGGRTVIEIRDQ